MTASGEPPVSEAAVRPLPSLTVWYPKPHEVVMLGLDTFPLLPEDLPYAAANPLIE